jgi:hypothetical protein
MMPLYRATVWVLTATAAVVDGDEGITRKIVEREASNKRYFEADVRDDYIHDVDNEVWFGPISQINPEKRKVKGRKYGFSS